MRGSETIQLIRLRPPNRFGEREELPPIDVDGCVIWPRTSTEDNARGEVVIAGLNIFAPAGTEILASDRIRARNADWEVEGEPGDYRTAGGRAVGVIVSVAKVGVPVAG